MADKVTGWMKGLVMTADEPDAVQMRLRAHDTAIITQDYGERMCSDQTKNKPNLW